MKTHIILYVKDQERSASFYSEVLGRKPDLHVPGMTEFQLSSECVLGIMPETGIKRLLGDGIPDPASASGIPRAEVYLLAEDPQSLFARALKAGAVEISPFIERDWGHNVAYCLDPDGHVLAFAKMTTSS